MYTRPWFPSIELIIFLLPQESLANIPSNALILFPYKWKVSPYLMFTSPTMKMHIMLLMQAYHLDRRCVKGCWTQFKNSAAWCPACPKIPNVVIQTYLDLELNARFFKARESLHVNVHCPALQDNKAKDAKDHSRRNPWNFEISHTGIILKRDCKDSCVFQK